MCYFLVISSQIFSSASHWMYMTFENPTEEVPVYLGVQLLLGWQEYRVVLFYAFFSLFSPLYAGMLKSLIAHEGIAFITNNQNHRNIYIEKEPKNHWVQP